MDLTCMVIVGLTLQFTTDCGSETVQLYGLINAIK